MLPVLNRAVYKQPDTPNHPITTEEVSLTTDFSPNTTVTTSDLKRAVTALAPVTKQRHTSLPILGYVQAHLSCDSLRLRATDMEVDMAFTIPVLDGPVEEQQFLIPGSILGLAVKALRQPRTRFTLEGTLLTVGAVSIEAKLEDDVNGFPAEPELYQAHPVSREVASVNALAFVGAMDRALLFASKDPTKPTLSAVLMAATHLVGTDGFALATEPVHFVNHQALVHVHDEKGESHVVQAPLMSRSPWKFVKGALKGAVGPLFISRDDLFVLFDQPGMRCFVRMVTGNYPAYHKVIPANFEHTIDLPRKEVLGALKEVDALKDAYNKNVLFYMSEEGLSVVFRHPDNGTATAKVPMSGLPTARFAFNLDYMLALFSSVPGDFVNFSYTTEVAVCRLEHVYLMPVRYAE